MIRRTATKTGSKYRVTFELPAEVGAEHAAICGEFNDWSTDSTPLKRRKDGAFSVTVSLEAGRSYRYRYLLDGERWENDWSADAYAPNQFGTDDSIVTV